jgi:ABC-type Na+ transport system ATPase subunit NatA
LVTQPLTFSGPLLEFDAARIEAGGATSEAWTARGGERRLALVGNFRPLFRLLASDATLISGSARLGTVPLAAAVARGIAGLAPLDPELIPDWTAERYLLETARLRGFDEGNARRAADAAIATFELHGAARMRVGHLFVAVQRVLQLAQATIGEPACVCVEAPLSGLEAEAQVYVSAAIDRALTERRLIVSLPALPAPGAERTLVERADYVMVERGGRIVSEGAPGTALPSGKRCIATVTRGGDVLLAALKERGFAVARVIATPELLGPSPALSADASAPSPAVPLQILVELHPGATPTDVFVAAAQAGVPLVELVAV